MLSWALQPFEEPFESVANPLAVSALAGPLPAVSTVTLILTALGIPVGAASLVVRIRRSRGVERQQLRWLALAAALLAATVLAMVSLAAAGLETPLGWLSAGCVAPLPLAIGAAILRYRLYDLDRIISRTVAYGLLTLLLGGGYALVLGLGQLLGRESPWLWRPPPWPWRRCSSRPAAASRSRTNRLDLTPPRCDPRVSAAQPEPADGGCDVLGH